MRPRKGGGTSAPQEDRSTKGERREPWKQTGGKQGVQQVSKAKWEQSQSHHPAEELLSGASSCVSLPLKNWNSVTSATFYWPKQVIGQAKIQGMEK